jgi:hypothetical protein
VCVDLFDGGCWHGIKISSVHIPRQHCGRNAR